MKDWIIAKTGQLPRLFTGLGLIASGGLVNLASIILVGSRAVTEEHWLVSLQLPAALMALIGFVFLCMAIKCPKCGAKWIWMAVSGKLGAHPLDSLTDLSACRNCGYRGKNGGVEDRR
jgi:DNA-directed RNA polymerase subunit RPC12/RpoP